MSRGLDDIKAFPGLGLAIIFSVLACAGSRRLARFAMGGRLIIEAEAPLRRRTTLSETGLRTGEAEAIAMAVAAGRPTSWGR